MNTTTDTLTEALPVTTHVTTDRTLPTDLPVLSQLDVLETEAIHIIREVAAEFERPVLLFSGGKDSVVDAAPRGEGVLARRRCRSRCCTSTPATTSPRCSPTATRPSSGSALRLEVASVQD